ncbi:MAG: sigma 54-interacting transcriptional regulator [Acidobacteriota bacterium]
MTADDPTLTGEARAAWLGVSAAFAALGRAFLCVDATYRILHASSALDEMLAPGTAAAVEGREAAELLGPDLFGPGGALRLALNAGERREGWRAYLRANGESRLVSVTAAPFPNEMFPTCDPRVAHVVVLRPADAETAEDLGSPTTFGGLIGRSRKMMRLFALLDNLKLSDATVLITGESGTGKELVARALHDQSPRRRAPFVPVNCGALPLELLESEMFGHARGAFTGAVRDRVGRFEQAGDGTLFLDEIGELPPPVQVKLLRVLQDGVFERVGENTPRQSRARIIAATNADLEEAVRAGRFREDLFYRLRVLPLHVPPLRERREDIEPLARVLLARVSARAGRALRFSPDAMRALLEHDWPGNVRELENAIEYAVAVCRGQTILSDDLPARPALDARTPAPLPAASPEPADPALVAALERHHWRREPTARALGISRSTLWRRMREAGLA